MSQFDRKAFTHQHTHPNSILDVDVAWRASIRPDTFGGQGVRQRGRVMHQSGLQGPVWTRSSEIDVSTTHGANDNDVTFRFLKERDGRLTQRPGAHDVDLKAAFPGVSRVLAIQQGDVCNYNIDATALLFALLYPRGELFLIGDIDRGTEGFGIWEGLRQALVGSIDIGLGPRAEVNCLQRSAFAQ